MILKYPNGICKYCGKEFERPHKHKTETEAFHQHGCNLKRIKNRIENEDDDWKRCELIEELKHISKISSLAVKRGVHCKYYDRMVECAKLIKKLENSQSNEEKKE